MENTASNSPTAARVSVAAVAWFGCRENVFINRCLAMDDFSR
jgi:hypothetical protein